MFTNNSIFNPIRANFLQTTLLTIIVGFTPIFFAEVLSQSSFKISLVLTAANVIGFTIILSSQLLLRPSSAFSLLRMLSLFSFFGFLAYAVHPNLISIFVGYVFIIVFERNFRSLIKTYPGYFLEKRNLENFRNRIAIGESISLFLGSVILIGASGLAVNRMGIYIGLLGTLLSIGIATLLFKSPLPSQVIGKPVKQITSKAFKISSNEMRNIFSYTATGIYQSFADFVIPIWLVLALGKSVFFAFGIRLIGLATGVIIQSLSNNSHLRKISTNGNLFFELILMGGGFMLIGFASVYQVHIELQNMAIVLGFCMAAAAAQIMYLTFNADTSRKLDSLEDNSLRQLSWTLPATAIFVCITPILGYSLDSSPTRLFIGTALIFLIMSIAAYRPQNKS